MLNKESYLKNLDILDSIMKRNSLDKVIGEKIDVTRKNINEYITRILLIGEFSAGKSAFINKLIDRDDLLKVAQAPETSIATEIMYDENEYVECITMDNDIKKISFSEAYDLNANDYRYLIYHVKSSYLEKISDVILVDMPGLNSNIENHNKAIAQYISKGSGYILLVGCDNGTLRNETKQFIREIRQYNQGLTCFVSKSDLKLPEDVDEVKLQIEQEINNLFDDVVNVETISILEDYDKFESKATKAIKSFNLQQLFVNRFDGAMKEIVDLEKYSLQTLLSAMELNSDEIDNRIMECEKNKKELEKKLNAELKDLDYNYNHKVIFEIEMDLKNALHGQVDNLTDAILMGKDAFSSLINSIIRPVIINSTQKHITKSFEDLIENIDISFTDSKFENHASAIQKILEDWKENRNSDKLDKGVLLKTGISMENQLKYKGITSALAIATTVINPVVELIIVFLPEILEALSAIYKMFKRDDLRDKVEFIIIPQIIEKIMPEIVKVVEEQKEILIDNLKEKFNEAINAEVTALENAKQDKQSIIDNYEISKKEKNDDLQLLETINF